MDFNSFLETCRVMIRRVVRSDFQRERATDDERRLLGASSTPVVGELVQDYAVWRRAVLWLAAVALVIHTLVQAVTFTSAETELVQLQMPVLQQQNPGVTEADVRAHLVKSFGAGNLEMLDTISILFLVAAAVGTFLVVIAAMQWTDIRKSRRMARFGWMVMFGMPLVLALLPWARMMDFSSMPAEGRKAMASSVGLTLGMAFFLIVTPKAIALFPGAIRSSMTLKTLLPENPMPGWVAALIAPLYSIFLVVMIITINQLQGDFLLVAGILCLMLGPLVNVAKAKDLLRAHSAEEAATLVGQTRQLSATFTIVGMVFLTAFVVNAELFNVGDALTFVFAMIGSVLLLTLVSADFFLALLHASHTQSKDFMASDLATQLDARFDELSASGLTEWGTKGGKAPPSPSSATPSAATQSGAPAPSPTANSEPPPL